MPRNLLIRAVRGTPIGEAKFVEEYREMCRMWKVTPYLATLLGDTMPVREPLGGPSVTSPTDSLRICECLARRNDLPIGGTRFTRPTLRVAVHA
jgi:hypothetical protein